MWKGQARFLKIVADQVGKPYIYGYEVKLNDPDPKAFDCSELVQWAYAQVGIVVPDGSYRQWKFILDHQARVSLGEAARLGGSLVFRRNVGGQISHVGISMGDGTVVEARGRNWGVIRVHFESRNWHVAGSVIPLEHTELAKTCTGSGG